MEQRTRTIILGAIILFAAVGLLILIYLVFFRNLGGGETPTNTNQGTVSNGNTGLPNINIAINNGNTNTPVTPTTGLPGVDATAQGNATITTPLTPDIQVGDTSAFSGGNLRYYNDLDGRFYRVNADGTTTQIGDAQFAAASTVTWSGATDEVIVEFPDGSNIYYDLATNQQVTLPKEYEEFDFSPDGGQIAFKFLSPDKERRVLAVSNPDGTGAKTLESLGDNEDRVQVQWSPTGKVAATFAEFIDLNRQEVGFIGLNGENFKGTVVEGRGLQYTYSPDGLQMLYSVYTQDTDYKPGLWLVDANGDDIGKNRIELNLTTSANKCTYANSGSVIYCGVPTDPRYGFGLEPEILDGVPDELYRIDLLSGTKTRIALPVDQTGTANFQITSMTITDSDDALIFQDGNSGELIRIDL